MMQSKEKDFYLKINLILKDLNKIFLLLKEKYYSKFYFYYFRLSVKRDIIKSFR